MTPAGRRLPTVAGVQTVHGGSASVMTRWWLALRRNAARHVLLVDAAIAVVPGGSIVWGTLGETADEPVGWHGVVLVVVAAL